MSDIDRIMTTRPTGRYSNHHAVIRQQPCWHVATFAGEYQSDPEYKDYGPKVGPQMSDFTVWGECGMDSEEDVVELLEDFPGVFMRITSSVMGAEDSWYQKVWMEEGDDEVPFWKHIDKPNKTSTD